MSQFHTQIVFVSGQTVPNVTPALDKEFRPQRILLCATDVMMEKAQELLDFFETRKIAAQVVPLGNAYDFESLKLRMLEIASEFDTSEGIGVNLTGGTKLITIAAQMIFGSEELGNYACFYVCPDTDEVTMINREQVQRHNLQNKLKLEDYFGIHGYAVESLKRKPAESLANEELFAAIFANYEKYRKHLSTLNFLASRAEDDYALSYSHNIKDETCDLLQLFYNHGAIKYYDNTRVLFKDNDSRSFCKGFWLEEYTLLALQQVAREMKLQDFASSVNIRSASGTPNELDAAFMHENNLYIIECKTAKMRDKGTEVVYKIDTIKGYAGLFTRPVIITFMPMESYDRQRASDLGIKLIEGAALKNLEKHLTALLN